jgi:hypothetical protein
VATANEGCRDGPVAGVAHTTGPSSALPARRRLDVLWAMLRGGSLLTDYGRTLRWAKTQAGEANTHWCA